MDGVLLSLFRYKAWANAEMHASLEKFDAHIDSINMRTILQILDHANVVDRIFKGHLGSPEQPALTSTNSEQCPDLAALRTNVSATDRWYLDFVASLSPASLQERVAFNFTDGDHGCMSREEMLLHVITHAGYHRGSVGQLLEDAVGNSPPDSLTKFLHRHEPERRLVR